MMNTFELKVPVCMGFSLSKYTLEFDDEMFESEERKRGYDFLIQIIEKLNGIYDSIQDNNIKRKIAHKFFVECFVKFLDISGIGNTPCKENIMIMLEWFANVIAYTSYCIAPKNNNAIYLSGDDIVSCINYIEDLGMLDNESYNYIPEGAFQKVFDRAYMILVSMVDKMEE